MMVWQTVRQWTAQSLTQRLGLVLGLGLTAIAPNVALADPLAMAFLPHVGHKENVMATPTAQATTAQLYLFGTTPQAGQLGHEYMVLQITKDQHVQGVFYQINSEFACFAGEMSAGKLTLAVQDPYEQVAYDYQLDYQTAGQVADGGDRLNVGFVPDGFFAIANPSQLDHDLLARCGYQNQATATVKG